MSIHLEGHVGAGVAEHFLRGCGVDVACRSNRGERAPEIEELMSRAKPLRRIKDKSGLRPMMQERTGKIKLVNHILLALSDI